METATSHSVHILNVTPTASHWLETVIGQAVDKGLAYGSELSEVYTSGQAVS